MSVSAMLALFANGINAKFAQYAETEQIPETVTLYKVVDGELQTFDSDDEDTIAARIKKGWSKTNPKEAKKDAKTSRAARNIRRDIPATRERLVTVSAANQAASLRVPDFAIMDSEAGFEVSFTGKITALVEVTQTLGNPYGKSLLEGDYKIQSGPDAGKVVTQRFAILFNSAKHDVGLVVNLKLGDNENTASGKGWEESK